ncbi:MAG: serine hydroxymethyltransferase [Pseudomonadota bacterium]
MNSFFNQRIAKSDPLIHEALQNELSRQKDHLELIASENIVSRAVLDALGHAMTNKTLEGYPGKRFHAGGEFVDVTEQAAIERARELFDCEYVNVQPHSGTQANQAIFFACLKPGDRILSLNLAAGGHLSHGAAPNQSGRWFDAHHYGVDPETGLIDYVELERLTAALKPKILITGGSAYPRSIDFERIAAAARSVEALFLVDMAHIAGLVAAKVHASPVKHADIVTCTTTKTLRGPRGGLILSHNKNWAGKLQSAIFPGVQGSLHSQIIAAKAVCLGEALSPEFRDYGKRVVDNARTLATGLETNGIRLVSGGTDTHMVLLDVSETGLKGQQIQDALGEVNITSNKNPIPFDSSNPAEWMGLRLGVAAITTRGLDTKEVSEIAEIIYRRTIADAHEKTRRADRDRVLELCSRFPLYT